VPKHHRVQCIKKADGRNPSERIARIGGINSVGVKWRLTLADAIFAMEDRRWAFYVEESDGRTVDVIVATTNSGSKYLKTELDNEEPTHLLALPECD
jgi:hypothetical protein